MTTEHEQLQGALIPQGRVAVNAFAKHRSEYETTLAEWMDSASDLRETDGRLRDLSHRLKLREAELRLTHEFTASNEAGRAAELLLACESDVEWLNLAAGHEATLTTKAVQTDALTALSNTMSLLKRSMDMELAWTRLLGKDGD